MITVAARAFPKPEVVGSSLRTVPWRERLTQGTLGVADDDKQ